MLTQKYEIITPRTDLFHLQYGTDYEETFARREGEAGGGGKIRGARQL